MSYDNILEFMRKLRLLECVFFLLAVLLLCVSCGDSNVDIKDVELSPFSEKNIVKNNRKAKIILSYEDSITSLWNYVIDIGHINNVPLSNLKDPKVYQKYTKRTYHLLLYFSHILLFS